MRVTHDLILRPASGLCLGKSLTFLSEALSLWEASEEEDIIAHLITAAQTVQNSENLTSVRLQAIYDALMGVQGKVRSKEKELFKQILRGNQSLSLSGLNGILLASLSSFLNREGQFEPLRQFVLNDLENIGVDITPDLYALILELDTLWDLQNHGERKNDAVHDAIIQAIAHRLQMELMHTQRLKGDIATVYEQLEELEAGYYLIQFTNHSMACVKTQRYVALFNPDEGLALFDEDDQQEGILQLLNYYGNHGSISLRLLAISKEVHSGRSDQKDLTIFKFLTFSCLKILTILTSCFLIKITGC